MTDKIRKSLAKLTTKEKRQVQEILEKLVAGDPKGLNLLKLKGSKDIYRARKGSIRIIFRSLSKGKIKVLAIERRSKDTYKNF
jgi:mRNA-degrading endonuclease RelE of RelBE toxin-antitoxin system